METEKQQGRCSMKRLIVQVKGSRGRLLFKLECGHVRVMPTCSDRSKLAVGKPMRCRDCEARERAA